jgi:hypothetical protein
MFSGLISYRVGLAAEGGVCWGPFVETLFSGSWPAVAISKEGYIVFVYNDPPERNANYIIASERSIQTEIPVLN